MDKIDKSFLLVFEGPEGSGKTTQAHRLARSLSSLGYDVLLTAEPGGTDFGVIMRSAIMGTKGLAPRASDFLFLADRIQHLEQVIKPALAEGKIVICDRYRWSTDAYIAARGEDTSYLSTIRGIQMDLCVVPDATVLMLPITVEIGDLVSRKTSEDTNRFDKMDLSFHEAVVAEYWKIARASSWKFVIEDAGQMKFLIASRILGFVINSIDQKISSQQ